MKKLITLVSVILLLVFLNSCGVNNAYILNQNQNTTEVQLAGNNYRIIGKATGSAEVQYVLMFGGVNKTQLFENAYADMVNNANLASGSKALINILTEEHLGGVPPFFYRRTVTVSAHVIEFTR